MNTIIYRIIDTLNKKEIITDKTFYYLLDTLPKCMTIPPKNI